MERKKIRSPRGQAVVLLSGGLDSAVALYLARREGFDCRCLIFDYGQRHRREIKSAKRIAQSAKCPYQVIKISLPHRCSSLLDRSLMIPEQNERAKQIPSTYVPARNIIFLSFALAHAETLGARAIFIGAHAQDYSGYPDCRPEFFSAFQKAAKTGLKKGLEIKTPLLNMGKARIIKLGNKLGVPFELTWSCYKGGKSPCGKCDSCFYRQKGFKEAGLRDPLSGAPRTRPLRGQVQRFMFGD